MPDPDKSTGWPRASSTTAPGKVDTEAFAHEQRDVVASTAWSDLEDAHVSLRGPGGCRNSELRSRMPRAVHQGLDLIVHLGEYLFAEVCRRALAYR